MYLDNWGDSIGLLQSSSSPVPGWLLRWCPTFTLLESKEITRLAAFLFISSACACISLCLSPGTHVLPQLLRDRVLTLQLCIWDFPMPTLCELLIGTRPHNQIVSLPPRHDLHVILFCQQALTLSVVLQDTVAFSTFSWSPNPESCRIPRRHSTDRLFYVHSLRKTPCALICLVSISCLQCVVFNICMCTLWPQGDLSTLMSQYGCISFVFERRISAINPLSLYNHLQIKEKSLTTLCSLYWRILSESFLLFGSFQ